jgi:hypothetical protein
LIRAYGSKCRRFSALHAEKRRQAMKIPLCRRLKMPTA